LLGPSGAGKTKNLQAISNLCRNGIIHASYDFNQKNSDCAEPTRDVLLKLSTDLSSEWPVRGTPQFIRYTLALIATNIVDIQLPNDIREKIEKAVKEFAANKFPKGVDEKIKPFIDLAISTAIVPPQIRPLIKPLTEVIWQPAIRLLAQRRVQAALDWHSEYPDAQGAAPYDALVRLWSLAKSEPEVATKWFVAAFLADVRESYSRTLDADRFVTDCPCIEATDRHHTHNWILLLDNVEHQNGQRFLDDLDNARADHLRGHPDERDPLIVVATSGRWVGSWTNAWCPPWIIPEQDDRHRLAVTRCKDAGYIQWARNNEASPANAPKYYPVLLDNLDASDVASELTDRPGSELCKNVLCVTGGLPSAVKAVARAMNSHQLERTAQDISALSHGPIENEQFSFARTTLKNLDLNEKLHDIGLDDIISAAPHLTAPWLVSTTQFPYLGQILEELRVDLWGTAISHKIARAGHAEIHPWLGRLLLLELRARQVRCDDYLSQFMKFKEGLVDAGSDAMYLNYCDLALGKVEIVAEHMAEEFDSESHASWIRKLVLITRAPHNMSLDQDIILLRNQIMEQHTPFDRHDEETHDRKQTIFILVTRLLVTSWLYGNPLGVPNETLRQEVNHHLESLARLSKRVDPGPLYNALDLLAPLPHPHGADSLRVRKTTIG
jgi:hypothetical protein